MQREFCEHFLNVAATMLSCKRKLQRWASKGKIIGIFKKLLKCYFAIKKKSQDATSLPLRYLYACIFKYLCMHFKLYFSF